MNLAAVLLLAGLAAAEGQAPLAKAWYSPQELLPVLAERDGLRWAMPEMLAGRAMVGGDVSRKELLDEACKQWGLAWTETGGVIVIHRADDEALRRRSAALAAGGDEAPAAAWELGWLGDARAVPALTQALASREPAVALAAAQAIEILLAEIPLGRDERVDAALGGRVSLAAAFEPKVDLRPLLDLPYPPVRAAALRVLLGRGGKEAEAALEATQNDRSIAVARVRQQHVFTPAPPKESDEKLPLFPLPDDPEKVPAACARLIAELPKLEKQSAWEEMCRRAETLAAWSRAGHDAASACARKSKT
jgi:hypothetical protein